MRCPYCGYENRRREYLCENCHNIINVNLTNTLNSYWARYPYAKCQTFENISVAEVAQWINSNGANIQILCYNGQLVGYGKRNWQFKFFYVIYNEQPCNEVYEMYSLYGGSIFYALNKKNIREKAQNSIWSNTWEAKWETEEWLPWENRWDYDYFLCSVILRAIPRNQYVQRMQYQYQPPAQVSQYSQPTPQYAQSSYQSSNGILQKIDNFINSIIDLI